MSDSNLRVVLVGWGAIGQRVAGLLAQRGLAGLRIVGVGMRAGAVLRAPLPEGAVPVMGPGQLADVAPDLVVEVAGRGSVAEWGLAALGLGADFVPASTSALTDAALLAAMVDAARAGGAQVLIPPGALGGIDALAAAARLPLDSVRHEIVKPPRAWAGTEAERLCDLAALTASVTFFEGTAAEAADRFPQNANVAVITALAGLGLAQTRIALVADPGASRNGHRITASGDFGTMTVALENRALEGNPKSSELTALSVVRLIENRAAPLVV